MNRIIRFSSISCLAIMLSCNSVKPDMAFYGKRIIIQKGISSYLKTVAKDLVIQLENATNENFEIVQLERDYGIRLFVKPHKQLINKPRGSFFIDTNKRSLDIYGLSEEAVGNGVYSFLEHQGFKYYFPGEKWTITPEIKNNFKPIKNELEVPEFESRTVFPSGGLHSHGVLDPKNNRATQWKTWLRRNKITEAGKIVAHAGQDYNNTNKNLLLSKPEFLAEIDGKRVDWYENAKHCISNRDFVESFVQNRVEAYQKKLRRFGKDHRRTLSIGVEPADGGKHCTCAPCMRMGSISDRVFHLANQVALKFDKLYPDVLVSIYAYHKHSNPPQIQLEENVHVSLVPYAFQKHTDPENLISDWSKKTSNLGMRDFFTIPVWDYERPQFSFGELDSKLALWKSYGINDMRIESSYGIVSAGITIYLFSKLSWGVDKNSEELLQELSSDLFGKASEPMLQLFHSWGENYKKSNSFRKSYKLLDNADRKEDSSIIHERISDFKAYQEYLRLLEQYLSNRKDLKAREQNVDALLKYIWTTYDNNMVHATSVAEVITNRLEKKNPRIKEKWNFRKGKMNAKTWNVKQLNDKEIESIFLNNKRNELHKEN